MSDTSTQVDPNKGTGKDGQFLGEDLAKLVKVSSEIKRLEGGDLISEVELEKLLSKRIGADVDNRGSLISGRERDIAEVIIDSLPKELRNAKVVEALDLRPYLKALNGKTIVHREESMGPDTSSRSKVDTTEALARVEDEYGTIVDGLAQGTELTDEERAKRRNTLLAYNDNMAGPVPGTSEAQMAYGKGESPGFAPTTVASQLNNYGFPEEQLAKMVSADFYTLDQLADAEAAMSDELGGGFFPIDVATGTLPTATGHGRDAIHPTKTLNVTDAVNYLSTLTPKEIASMQVKMAAAGYFDTNPAGYAYVEGDAHDPATMAAWKALLTDSIKTRTPVPSVLGNKVRTYREEAKSARLRAMPEIDSSVVNMDADNFARSVIGRRLTTEEHQALQSYLVGLRDKRAGFVHGAADNPVEGAMTTEEGYTTQDIEGFVSGKTSWEADTNAQQERMYTLNKMMGG